MKKFNFWDMIKSPKTVAVLKLGVAIAGVFHAIDELQTVSKKKNALTTHH